MISSVRQHAKMLLHGILLSKKQFKRDMKTSHFFFCLKKFNLQIQFVKCTGSPQGISLLS